MKKNKHIRRLLITFGTSLVIAIILISIYKLFLDPYRGTISTTVTSMDLYSTLRKEDAVEDLNYIVDRLKQRHPACMDGLPSPVQDQLEKETTVIGDEVSVLELWQSAARILAKMEDAHTVVWYNGTDLKRLPLKFKMLDDKLYCISEGYQNAIVKSMNGIPVEVLHERFMNQFSYELEGYGTYQFANHLPYKNYLEFVGVNTDSDITLTFQTEGTEWEETLALSPPIQETEISDEPFVTFEIDEDHSLGILKLRSCNFNDDYRATVRDFFTKIKEYKIEHVSVDLRNNGGGNSDVINEFLRYLDIDEYYITGGMDVRIGPFLYKMKKHVTKNNKFTDLLFTGKVYALTSTNSFSSAEMFANTLQDNGIGQIIGETPGNMPASYGDVLTFQTPNSKLLFTISYKYFQRIDTTKSALPLIPDYEVKAEEAQEKLYEIIQNSGK